MGVILDVAVSRLDVTAYTIPTDQPEADGTFAWDSTTIVVVEATGGGQTGLGYTYAGAATARLIVDMLAGVVCGADALAPAASWDAMIRAIRNIGRPGVASMAIAAVDAALWDLKAHLLGVPLVVLLGKIRDGIMVYGSGGFTTYSIPHLQEQLRTWVDCGIPRVKMKIGTHPDDDLRRVRAAWEAIGPDARLFIDANGAYDRKHALDFSRAVDDLGVTWFEEPVSSDDLDGLRLLRDHAPAGIEIAAGEYGYSLRYFRQMLDAGAVDVLQADATRCAGISEFLRVGALCEARSMPLSAHTAPSLHAHPCCALGPVRHVEYFHDHARIERMLFDGTLTPVDGELRPDLSRPGMGLELKRADAERWRIAL